ncbi:MAG: hypothetical protein CUN55_00690 [Phototrophicales bacterium]|nr:MAG: hypothetical protein CUN55_00690 [Phototrophicales bacterium]
MSEKYWWGTRASISPRLQLEVEYMGRTFGDTFRLEWEPPERLYWIGTIELNLSQMRYRHHTLKIIYPKYYPNHPPEAYVVAPKIYSNKHQFEDGQLCLFNPKDGSQYGWNPSTSTAVTVAGWAIEWLYAYYTWRATGIWPGVEGSIAKSKHRWFSWKR